MDREEGKEIEGPVVNMVDTPSISEMASDMDIDNSQDTPVETIKEMIGGSEDVRMDSVENNDAFSAGLVVGEESSLQIIDQTKELLTHQSDKLIEIEMTPSELRDTSSALSPTGVPAESIQVPQESVPLQDSTPSESIPSESIPSESMPSETISSESIPPTISSKEQVPIQASPIQEAPPILTPTAPAPAQSVRYQTLVDLSTRCLEESIKYLTLERVMACYPTVSKHPKAKQAMEQALKQIIDFWRKTAQKEFTAIFEERDIKNKLAELEQLIKEAYDRRKLPSQSRQAWDNPVFLEKLTPEQIVACNLRQAKLLRISQLKAQIASVQEENTRLREELVVHESNLSSMVELMQRCLKDLESAVSAVNQLPVRTELVGFVANITR